VAIRHTITTEEDDMGSRWLPQIAALVAALGVVSGCGSGSHPAPTSSPQYSGSGSEAPAQLTGTYTATISRQDRTGAPRPAELPIGRWTLIIANTGGPNNGRALTVGPGDTGGVSFRFGAGGSHVAIGCNDDQDLPTAGSQTYTWSISGGTLRLTAVSPRCTHGGANNQLILTSHRWIRHSAPPNG
jgi:hypothetical protein